MKRIILYFSVLLFSLFLVTSCIDFDDSFDESMLIGKWESGTLYYKYLIDGTGTTWDEGDDVMEDEAQSFTWTLVEAELTHIHIMEMGGTVPKIYTVTQLSETSLKYEDSFGKTFSFTKVSTSP